jgi:hypothetical protein
MASGSWVGAGSVDVGMALAGMAEAGTALAGMAGAGMLPAGTAGVGMVGAGKAGAGMVDREGREVCHVVACTVRRGLDLRSGADHLPVGSRLGQDWPPSPVTTADVANVGLVSYPWHWVCCV